MEEPTKSIESLLSKATEYGKTSYELIKLKALEKTSDALSSFIPNATVFLIIGSLLLFSSLGLAFWLGEILGRICYGFFAVAVFYAIIAIVLHFFMHQWLKKIFCNYFIKKILNSSN